MKKRKIFRTIIIIAYLICIGLWVWRFTVTKDTDCLVIIMLWVALITSDICYWKQHSLLKSSFETEDTLFKVIEDNHKMDLDTLTIINKILKMGDKEDIEKLISNLDNVTSTLEETIEWFETTHKNKEEKR